ncbi:MAG: hypothetical protein ABW003_23175 [Microvirga sp.]
MSQERAIMDDWYPKRLAPRDGTPVILWIEDEAAPPIYPVTVGVWELDDMRGRSHWRVFGARYGTHIYFDQHVVGWRPLPRFDRA